MRFKDYRNPHKNDNRIYSYTDLYNMPFGELIKNKKEILGQYRVLGVPREKELQGSDNVVYVEAYTREDGTEVKAHYRSKPGGGTSHSENEVPTGEASEVSENNTKTEKQENKQNDNRGEVQEHEKSTSEPEKDERLYPQEIAGVKRGEPKSFEDVVNRGVNPTYEKTIEDGEEDGNCNSCVAAYVYCRRGYDVNAASTIDNEKAEELSHNGFDLWVEPETGKLAEWTEIDNVKQKSFDYLDNTIQQGEIYEFAQYPQLKEGDLSTISGHVVVVEKGSDNQLKIYDPQKREVYINNEQSKMYFDSWVDAEEMAKDIKPKVIRVDNKQINPYYEGVLVH